MTKEGRTDNGVSQDCLECKVVGTGTCWAVGAYSMFQRASIPPAKVQAWVKPRTTSGSASWALGFARVAGTLTGGLFFT